MPDSPIDPRALLGFDQLADDAHEPTTTARLLSKIGVESSPSVHEASAAATDETGAEPA